jgi:hypothetical protein
MAKSERQRIRVLADRYHAAGHGWVYAGREEGAGHYFTDCFIQGDDAALAHMILLCERAGVPTE